MPASTQRGRGRQAPGPTITEADADAIAWECRAVKAVSPCIPMGGQVIGGNVNWQPDQMLGVGPGYPIVRNWTVASGEFFTDRDVAGATKVCVIGHTLVKQLFPDVDPVGQPLRVNNIPFRVVGVLARKGANLVGQDQDNVLLMPYTTVRKRLLTSAFSNVGIIFVSAQSDALSPQAEREIRDLLIERHKIPIGAKPDFEINNTAEIAGIMNVVTGSLTPMLSAPPAIPPLFRAFALL